MKLDNKMAMDAETTARVAAFPTPCAPPRQIKPWYEPIIVMMNPKQEALVSPDKTSIELINLTVFWR